jgi:2-oxoisovalerate dehydrogenase E1 component alpha subunit
MDEDGALRDPAVGQFYLDSHAHTLDASHAIKMYRTMARLSQMDNIFLNAQRQGRISFYMSSQGEEAVHIGEGGVRSQERRTTGANRQQKHYAALPYN